MKSVNNSIAHYSLLIVLCSLLIVLLSCAIENQNDGTLILKMPGGANARAVSDAFLATLTYRIDCEGHGSVSRTARAGEAVSIPLAAGDWNVTVTVFNAAEQEIGEAAITVTIEAGKTTRNELPITLDKSGCDITQFRITSPSAEGIINQTDRTINVFVPTGTSVNNMQYSLMHTGRAVSPVSGGTRNFGSPQTFTVTAEDGTEKEYTVTVTLVHPGTHGLQFQSRYDDNGWSYSVSKGTSTAEDVVIPAYHNGLPVTMIDSFAFYHYENLKSIVIPNSVTSIGEYAFRHCENLTGIMIPDSVTAIGRYSFSHCDSLTSITIGKGVTSIGEYAFYYSGLWNNTADDSVVYADKWAVDCKWALSSDLILSADTEGIGDRAFIYSKVTSVTIPNSVKSIGYEAFMDIKDLTSVAVGNSVTSIGVRAFAHCESLMSVTMGNSVTSIGRDAFAYCGNLTSITIPNSVTSIGDGAFSGCGLTSVTIPSGVVYIGSAFNFCADLASISVDSNNQNFASDNGILYNKMKTELICFPAFTSGTFTIPDSVTSIGFAAFVGSRLTGVTIPPSVVSIGERAFSGSSLTGISIPATVRNIGGWVFSYSGLTSVTIPATMTSIGDGMFFGCEKLTSVTIPNSVTSIGYQSFSHCASLTNITIPNSVTRIYHGAFDRSGLISITIPNSVTSIESSAFSGCENLTSVVIGNGVTSIEYDTFRNCINLTTVTIHAVTPPSAYGRMFECDKIKDDEYNVVPAALRIEVPPASVNAYKTAYGWSEYADRIFAIILT